MTSPQDKTEPEEDLAQMVIGLGPCTYLLLLLLGLILVFPSLRRARLLARCSAFCFPSCCSWVLSPPGRLGKGSSSNWAWHCLGLAFNGPLCGLRASPFLTSSEYLMRRLLPSRLAQCLAIFSSAGQLQPTNCMARLRVHHAGLRLVLRLCPGRDIQRWLIRPWSPRFRTARHFLQADLF